MGEIADDMVRGACCSDCGVYFEEDHGYPVLCKHCWERREEEGLWLLGYQRATRKEI